MKIEAITLREIHMPLVRFFETSFGRTISRRILLATVHCEGVQGWGECTAGEHPFFSEECTDTAWHVLKEYLAPALAGVDLANGGREAAQRMAQVRGHRMAKAALENAVWDAEAQAKAMPLWKLIGGTRQEIACGVSIGIQDSHDELLDRIAMELEAGYQRIKIKVKPGWDLDVLGKVRQRFPGALLSCDANSAYTLDDLEHLKKFDDFRLLMIEQPLWPDEIYMHALLQHELSTSICLDECIVTARHALEAIQMRACRILNIKLGRVGGFSEAIRTHDVALNAEIPVWCGGMLESGLGRAHNIALSTLSGFSLPGDVSASARYWKDDIIEPEVTVSSLGTIQVPDQPGRGYALREDLIESLTVRKETIRPHGV
ncbi:MAG: o-succinylbenzoate synthase [Acidobacteriota bacterium]|nr:o-succinylbenzoate synthase [Acidobacteriota bacterium]